MWTEIDMHNLAINYQLSCLGLLIGYVCYVPIFGVLKRPFISRPYLIGTKAWLGLVWFG